MIYSADKGIDVLNITDLAGVVCGLIKKIASAYGNFFIPYIRVIDTKSICFIDAILLTYKKVSSSTEITGNKISSSSAKVAGSSGPSARSSSTASAKATAIIGAGGHAQ